MFTQLYSRLSKVGVCVSHKTTIRIVDNITKNFNSRVKDWCLEIGRRLLTHMASERLTMTYSVLQF